MEPLIFDLGSPGRTGFCFPEDSIPLVSPDEILPKNVIRTDLPELPDNDELTVLRHYTKLSQINFCIETGFYPLGSCTMKYNPKIHDELASNKSWTMMHPLQPVSTAQGCLGLISNLEHCLCVIFGMDAFSLQPAAGAHGELTGLMMIKAYHRKRNESRKTVLIPTTAHGTNPASAAMCGYELKEIKTNMRGNVDLSDLKANLSADVAALMLTNPNTLGLFEEDILDIADMVHTCGALLYYDGANANAILGKARPGDMGFDVMHVNLHKTFSTPHGGGGPGSGPVGVKTNLEPYLPTPRVARSDEGYYYLRSDYPDTIGPVKAFYGNFLIALRAYCYIKSLGGRGLTEVSEIAVLNANYMCSQIRKFLRLPYDRICKHEFVVSAEEQKEKGVKAGDIAKGLLDHGFHAPTVYFPLIIYEALMIEPTETECREELDRFIGVLRELMRLADENPTVFEAYPEKTSINRLDEAAAARHPDISYKG